MCYYIQICLYYGGTMYRTKILMKSGGKSPSLVPTFMEHSSMGELLDWIDANGMVFSEEELNEAAPPRIFFTVKHTDGSPLSEDETAQVKEIGSREMYKKRVDEASKPFFPPGK